MAKEDGIYAMRFASQQMLIDKLQQENKQLKETINRVLKYIDSQTRNMPRNGCSQRLSRIKKMLKEVSE